MTRFAQGTDPEYIKKVNEAMYGTGRDNLEIKEQLLEEAEEIIAKVDVPDMPITTTTTSTQTATAGLGDNKMIIYLVVGGVLIWYLNKEGYLKKILK